MSMHPILMLNTTKLKHDVFMRLCLSEWTDVKEWYNENNDFSTLPESTKLMKIVM